MKMLNGRILLEEELPKTRQQGRLIRGRGHRLYRKVHAIQGIKEIGDHVQCQRCESYFDKQDVHLDFPDMYYCPNCLKFHRVTSHKKLYTLAWQSPFSKQASMLTWQGKLSPFQQKVSDALFTSKRQQQLILAVTGAGKTEMIFPFVDKCLRDGKRVVYVAPRVDVVREIGQRFRQAFQGLDIPILYGDTPERYRCRQLTACTIQQLVRFKACIDILIMDEIDAFPYAHNTFLQKQVKKALTQEGREIYLTATVTDEVEPYLKSAIHLPLRYHLKPLPEPKMILTRSIYKDIQKQRLSWRRKQHLKDLVRPVLCFFPNISHMKQFEKLLRRTYKTLNVASASSQDEDRFDKIQKMYNRNYDVLLTTMILERGVTFPNIDIWIMDAHHTSYTSQALIQISGRAGRSKDYPIGHVLWFADGITKAMREASQTIKQRNREGRMLLDEVSRLS